MVPVIMAPSPQQVFSNQGVLRISGFSFKVRCFFCCLFLFSVICYFCCAVIVIISKFCCFCVVILKLILALGVSVVFSIITLEGLCGILMISKLPLEIMILFYALRPWSLIDVIYLNCLFPILITQHFCLRVILSRDLSRILELASRRL